MERAAIIPFGGIFLTLLLSSCATNRAEKPLLTASTSRKIAEKCSATAEVFHRNRPNLPYAVFSIKDGDPTPDGEPTPTVLCLGKALEPYRHLMFSLDTEPQPGK